MAFNWQKELEKLERAYDQAIADNDYLEQEIISREIWEIENNLLR